MKIIVIGATGTIGKAVADLLAARHDVVRAASRSGDVRVDITSRESIDSFYKAVGKFDALICAAGRAAFGNLGDLRDEDFQLGLTSKLMGQVNLVRIGRRFVADQGSFTLTSGVLSHAPTPGSAAISLVNAGLEGFVRAAALEMTNGVRVNAVSPVWVSETLAAMGRDPSSGLPADRVALAYRAAVESRRNGDVIDVREFA